MMCVTMLFQFLHTIFPRHFHSIIYGDDYFDRWISLNFRLFRFLNEGIAFNQSSLLLLTNIYISFLLLFLFSIILDSQSHDNYL